MIRLIAILMTLLWCTGCSNNDDNKNRVVIETQYGDIEIELFAEKAPKTVTAFLSYVDSGIYESSSFYRILSEDNQPMGTAPASLIQAGLWKSGNDRPYLKGITHESTLQTGLSHLNGSVSMARQDTGTATTEFFICLGDQLGFDYGGENNADGQGYAVFGRVKKGMDVVKKIYRRPEESQYFSPKVTILNIKRK